MAAKKSLYSLASSNLSKVQTMRTAFEACHSTRPDLNAATDRIIELITELERELLAAITTSSPIQGGKAQYTLDDVPAIAQLKGEDQRKAIEQVLGTQASGEDDDGGGDGAPDPEDPEIPTKGAWLLSLDEDRRVTLLQTMRAVEEAREAESEFWESLYELADDTPDVVDAATIELCEHDLASAGDGSMVVIHEWFRPMLGTERGLSELAAAKVKTLYDTFWPGKRVESGNKSDPTLKVCRAALVTLHREFDAEREAKEDAKSAGEADEEAAE